MARAKKIILFLAMVGEGIRSAACQNTHASTLYRDLFSDYNNGIIPTADLSDPLSVSMKFYIASIQSINEVEQTFSMMTGLVMFWADPNLTWEPSLNGNVSKLIVKADNIWTPTFYLVNQVDNMQSFYGRSELLCTILHNGRVQFGPGALLTAKCPMDVSKFPYDSQTCRLQFVSWDYPSSEIVVSAYTNSIALDFYTELSGWTLQESKTFAVNESTGYSMYYVEVTVKRESLYYTVMIILPTLMFALVNPLVFVIPAASGERISLSVTILLSYTVFLTLISSSIPTASNPMCMLLVVMITITGVSAVILCGAIVTVKYFYQESERPVGRFLKFVAGITRKRNDVKQCKDGSVIVDGKDVSLALDTIFYYASYLFIFIVFLAFFIEVKF